MAAVLVAGTRIPEPSDSSIKSSVQNADTVTYQAAGYKIGRRGNFKETVVADSTMFSSVAASFESDTSDMEILSKEDSIAQATAEFEKWYSSLTPKERRAYDKKTAIEAKVARADSLREIKEEEKIIRDSIAYSRLRILETYALPDSLQYKRIVSWTLDQDFQKMDISIPDTSYNYHFDDYPFRRNDVNASWLGVAGSPVQYYNFFKRRSRSGYDFITPTESWSYNQENLPHYNTKTPYTELAYYGTLLSSRDKESDNIHLQTTQNIFPSFNINLLFDKYGGAGILEHEETRNTTFVGSLNYLGKKYMMHAGYIMNTISRQENFGISDPAWVRDTTVEARDIPVISSAASSETKKHNIFIDQQFRIPFNFINRIKARGDTTFVLSDSLDRNITTAFIGHSSSFNSYSRTYSDGIAKDVSDVMAVKKIDNRVFLKLQPWAESAIVSKLNVGIGDYLEIYSVQYPANAPGNQNLNSIFAYAGVEGQIKQYFNWDAKGHMVFLGEDKGDFDVEANATLNFYPFRRYRKSPLSLGLHFETSLLNPDFYRKHFQSNTVSRYGWNQSLAKESTTKVQARLAIPHWKFDIDFGYALLGNHIYYGENGMPVQSGDLVNVLSASLHKEFVIGFLHLDNTVLVQKSSAPDILPLPLAAVRLKYFAQFVVQRDAQRDKVLEMQFGVNALYNTPWTSPHYNPVIGVFQNQNTERYSNGPIFDVFINAQWKRACIFIKFENIGNGWPAKSRDYFTADGYLYPQMNGLTTLKLGIFWPFYIQPHQNRQISFESKSKDRN